MRGPLNGLIADYMSKNNLKNVREFADDVGIGRSTVYDLVRGRSTSTGVWMKPSLDTIIKLATILNKPTHEILYLLEPSAPGATEAPPSTPVGAYQVPVLIAGRVGAGPSQLDEVEDYTYVEAAFAHRRNLTAFRVEGSSMAGGKYPIYNGDLVIVDKNLQGEINSTVVARLNSEGYICKRLRPGNILDSTNPEFLDPDLALITPDRIASLVGKVVRIIHPSI